MKTLAEILIETGLSYGTLVRYRDMGLIPKPERIWHGRKGSESVYPDSVPDIIHEIQRLKEQGLTLSQIKDRLLIKLEGEPVRMSSTSVETYIKVAPGFYEALKQKLGQGKLIHIEADLAEREGELVLMPPRAWLVHEDKQE